VLGVLGLVLVAALVVSSTRWPPARPLVVTLENTKDGRAFVSAHGLSGGELRALDRAALDAQAWQELFLVTVTGNDLVPVAGRYVVTSSAVEFHPTMTFDRTQRYVARFTPARLPTPRPDAAVTTSIAFAATAVTSSTVVTRIDPGSDEWPENMLRFYIHFSAPMSRGHRVDFVHLVDDAGKEVPDAILAAYADLWNPDATRLTVFFDPGRVKRGVGPNVAMGRALVRGQRYAIMVDAAWPDATGQPLKTSYRHAFTAGAAAYDALNVNDWRITTPAAATTAAIGIVFPAPLDRALLERTIGVETNAGASVDGRVQAGAKELSWSFTPNAPWQPGSYAIVVARELEDPAGNRIGRAFEVLESAEPAAPTGAVVRLPITVR